MIPQRSPLQGSAQQEAIWRAVTDGDSHLCVIARAGAGKTTTSVEACFRLPRRMLIYFLAFNKSAASEVKHRLPRRVIVKTLHALGYALCRQCFNSKYNKAKTTTIVGELSAKHPPTVTKSVHTLVGKCKTHLFEASEENLRWLVERYGLILGREQDEVFAIVPKVLAACRDNTREIDFDDMPWLPVVCQVSAPKAAFCFVDEAQDLNACQHELVSMLAHGRVLFCGDPRQAIYAFRGASSESMSALGGLLAKTQAVTQYSLSMSRRCPHKHIQLVQRLVPDIQAIPGAKEGVVQALSKHQTLAKIRPGSLVLCRSNAPLLSLAFRLLRDNCPVTLRGNDVGRHLLDFLKELGADRIGDLPLCVERYRHKARQFICDHIPYPNQALIMLQEKCDCLRTLAKRCTSLEQLRRFFQRLSPTQQPQETVTLSTIHRAKGDEAKSVFVLEPNLLPHPLAATPWEMEQELNLAYIAGTRSTDQLFFVEQIPAIYS